MSLFRSEALTAAAPQHFGQVLIVQPTAFARLSLLAVAVALVAAPLVVFGEFSRSETVLGYLAPRDGVAAVPAPRGGIVTRVHVRDGDHVAEGAPLVTLSTELAAGDGPGVMAAQLVEIEARMQEQRVQGELNLRRLQAEARRTAERIEALVDDIAQLERQAVLSHERVALAHAQWVRWEEVGARGVVAAGDLDGRRQELLGAQLAGADIERQVATRRSERDDLRHTAETLVYEISLAASRSRAELAALAQARQELRGAMGYTLLAPVAGRVTSVQATPGLAARPDLPLVTLLPDGDQLRAQLFTPTRAAGFIAAGQPVRLRIDAFPYQRFGSLEGHIEEISRAVLSPHEVAGPIAVQEPVYRLVVELEAQSMNAYGAAQALQAGMTLQADLIIDQRALWRWFLDPVLAVRGY